MHRKSQFILYFTQVTPVMTPLIKVMLQGNYKTILRRFFSRLSN